MVGAYGVGEVLVRLEQGFASPAAGQTPRSRTRICRHCARCWAIKGDVRCARRSSASIFGIVPGAGATIASFVAMASRRSTASGAISGQRHRRKASSRRRQQPPPRSAAHWCRCSRSASRAAAPPPSFSARSLLHGVQPGPQVFADVGAAGLRDLRVAVPWHRHDVLIGLFRDSPADEDARISRSRRVGVRA